MTWQHSVRYTHNGWHCVTHVYVYCMMTLDHNLMQSDSMTPDLDWIYPINGQRCLIFIVMHQEQDLHLNMYWLWWKMIDSPMDIYMTINGHYYFERWFTLLQITLKDNWTLMLVWRRDGHDISIWYNGFQEHIVSWGHLKARMIEAKARDFDFVISRDFHFVGAFDF